MASTTTPYTVLIGLSRVVKATYPDGNATTTSYSGNATTVTDASSNATKTLTDALGRVVTVYEDPGTGTHLNLQTQYTYDAIGDLTYVSKCPSTGCGSGQQNRSFTFDMLGRVTQAVNPESGTYSYSYTNSQSGNQLALQSRTDPRGFTTTYIRDAMDRVTGINYNDGTPNATYTYSPIGNLTQSSNSNVTNNYTTFDKDGRVTASNVQIGSLTYSFSYQYDLAGDLIQETYPSGRTVNTTYDIATRPTSVNGVSGGTTTNYVQQVGYYPHGAVQYWAYGNNLWSWQTFSKLLQPYQGWASQGNNGNNWMFYAGNSFNPNETVQQQQEGYSQAGTPGVPWNSLSTLQAQFGYDSLNRLNSVTDTGYARGYHYDEFGNLSVQSNTNVPLSSVTPFYNGSANPYNAATNHTVTVDANNGYDGRGNITKLAVNTVTMGYDAESNMTSTVDTGTGQNISWVYDAEGRRAQKSISGGSWTLYIHDAFGQLAASYNNNGVTPDCTTCYLTYDMVGTRRLITDQNENVVARHDFIPFGEEIQNGVALRNGNFGFTSNVTQAFTGQESDGGTVQLDYFNARHLSAVLGGFVQPDPMNAGADIMSPQSWNAYGYVLGNPLGLVDPSGMTTITKVPSSTYGSYCNLDGLSSPCGLTGSLLANGSAAICPNNICGQFGTDSNGQTTYYQFSSYAGGLSGYVPVGVTPYEIQETAFGNTYTSYGNITLFTAPGDQIGNSLLSAQSNVPGEALAWATSGKHDKVHGLWTYGNWCGVGGSGSPKDGLDAACLVHDYCYATHRFGTLSNFAGQNSALQGCNQSLCNTASSVQRNRYLPLGERDAAGDVRFYFGGDSSNGNGGVGVLGLFGKGNACQGPF